MFFGFGKPAMVTPEQALLGPTTAQLATPTYHDVLGTELHEVPAGCEVAYLALGCFWGAEKLFWSLDGVRVTAAGYQGGYTENPSYEMVCSGFTGHTEAVKVVFDPSVISYADLLHVFYENHDPTQGMRQGNDIGTQYRSAIYPVGEQQAETARRVTAEFQQAFTDRGFGEITTEIAPAGEFYYAEAYHQQYLDKNPAGYCPVHATGVTCR